MGSGLQAQCLAPQVVGGSSGQTTASLCTLYGGTITIKVPNFSGTDVIWYYRATSSSGLSMVIPSEGIGSSTGTFSQPGYYSFYQQTSGCGNSRSPELYVSGVNYTPSAPVISASSLSFCTGSSVTLSASGDADSYSWYNSGNSTVSTVVSVADSYHAVGTNVCGTGPSSNVLTITQSPRLQSSGPIRLSDINNAMGRSLTTANTSLNGLIWSANSSVTKSTPNKISYFFNYCH